jgi:ABC-type uncharacterized transport system substrate-binding protein
MREWIDQILALAAALGLMAAQPALSHPHVWIDTRAVLHFDERGRLTTLGEEWVFDDGYAAFVVEDLDKNGDGVLSSAELQPIIDQNTATLEKWAYFTVFKVDGRRVTLGPAADAHMDYAKDQLTFSFTLPLSQPLDVDDLNVAFSIFDPTFYIEIVPAETKPVRLEGDPKGCSAKLRPFDTTTQRFIPDTYAFSIKTDPKEPENSVGAQFAEWVDLSCRKQS